MPHRPGSTRSCCAVPSCAVLQVYLDEHLAAANKQPVAVGALLFAAPNVGDDAFVAEYNMKVNARRISFIYDMIPQVPCAPTMMACKGTDFLTALPGVRSWNYGKVSFEQGCAQHALKP